MNQSQQPICWWDKNFEMEIQHTLCLLLGWQSGSKDCRKAGLLAPGVFLNSLSQILINMSSCKTFPTPSPSHPKDNGLRGFVPGYSGGTAPVFHRTSLFSSSSTGMMNHRTFPCNMNLNVLYSTHVSSINPPIEIIHYNFSII